jgi:protocatechuate 3,4-dioxygenase alpha subunit
VFARGVLNRLATRLYFEGDPALAEDPVLKLVDPARRGTLIATRDEAGVWRLPLYLGGPNETVFFDC